MKALGVIVAVLVIAAIGVLVHDSRRSDRVAEGVRVGAVDVGGMSRAAARRAVEQRYASAGAHDVVVTWHGRRFTLPASTSGVRLDARATVDEAIARSRGGNAFSRTWRGLTGGTVDADVEPVVRWSPPAVSRFAGAIARHVDRRARDADIDFVAYRIRRTRARNGLRLERVRLEREVTSRLRSPRRDPVVAAPVRVSHRPDRTLADLARRYPRVITVSRTRKILRLYVGLKLAKMFRVAIGQVGHRTPAGRYKIETMQKDPAWHVPDEAWAGSLAGRTIPPGDPQNPLEARWMGFHDGAGIHGTKELGSLGAAASHGCVRMAIPDVKRLYRRVRVGTPVFIA